MSYVNFYSVANCKFSVLHRRAKNIIENQFVSVCVEEQDILGTAAAIRKFLGLIPDEQLRQDLEKELQKHSTSKERWEVVLRHVNNLRDKVPGT
jgi:DNA-directed RNA polymerase subunit K/omega